MVGNISPRLNTLVKRILETTLSNNDTSILRHLRYCYCDRLKSEETKTCTQRWLTAGSSCNADKKRRIPLRSHRWSPTWKKQERRRQIWKIKRRRGALFGIGFKQQIGKLNSSRDPLRYRKPPIKRRRRLIPGSNNVALDEERRRHQSDNKYLPIWWNSRRKLVPLTLTCST